ncbi:hypothetical protein Q5752_002237 [Cryptotrichosporon argae]
MPKDPNARQYSAGLSYVAQKPAFLQNLATAMGAVPVSGPGSHAGSHAGSGLSGSGRGGREAVPERPETGQWAAGSGSESGSEDEWEQRFGGGDDGPQVVVLKEGRHMTADEVRRERRRTAGKTSQSPPPLTAPETAASTGSADTPALARLKVQPRPKQASNKRKLVGGDDGKTVPGDKAKGGKEEKKKKAKASKGLLSFNEAEGE